MKDLTEKIINIPYEYTNPDEYISELQHAIEEQDGEDCGILRKRIRDLNANTYYDQRDIKKIEEIYKRYLSSATINNTEQEYLVGGIGFYLFSHYANFNELSMANDFLRNINVLNFIADEYDISFLPDSQIDLFKVGSTSFIFKITEGNKPTLVLKLVRFIYRDDPRIISDISNYKNRVQALKRTPKIIDFGRNWLLMDYIEGCTLDELIQQYPYKRVDDIQNKERKHYMVKRLEWAKMVCSSILDTLAELESIGVCHYDLSPRNMIIQENPLVLVTFFIDFGFNSLLANPQNKAQELLEAEKYVAPELLLGDNNPGIVSDFYSLGIILLEIFGPRGTRMEADKIDNSLDNLWLEHPKIAVIIDDLLTVSLKHRAIDVRYGSLAYNKEQKHCYSTLKNRLVEAVEAEINDLRTSFLKLVSNSFFSPNSFLFLFADTFSFYSQKAKDRFNTDLNQKKLILFGGISIFSLAVCLTFGVYAINDLDQAQWLKWLKSEVFSFYSFKEAPFFDTIPGRAVSISFAVVATVYYWNIFKSLNVFTSKSGATDDSYKYRKRVEFWIRMNSFCYVFPILWALIFDPFAWPFCSALGLFFVGMNNWRNCSYANFIKSNLNSANFRFSESPSISYFFTLFDGWASLIFIYSTVLVFIGFLLYLIEPETINLSSVLFFGNFESNNLTIGINIADWAFASTVLIVNYFSMQCDNCTKQAPIIKTNLYRLFETYKRHYKSLSHHRYFLSWRIFQIANETHKFGIKFDNVILPQCLLNDSIEIGLLNRISSTVEVYEGKNTSREKEYTVSLMVDEQL